MNGSTLKRSGYHRVSLPVFLMVLLTFGFAAVAQAQDPSKDQYGSPTDAGESAITSADLGDGNANGGDPGSDSGRPASSAASASASATDTGEGGGAGFESAGSVGDGSENSIEALPSTGGAMLPFLAMGGVALIAAGLITRQLALRGTGGTR